MFLHVCVCPQGGVPGQVHPLPRQVHTPQAGTSPAGTPPDRYIPWAGTPPPEQCMLGDEGNKQVVRILLECILVYYY